jgi:Flp pilus assembly pilin Flp
MSVGIAVRVFLRALRRDEGAQSLIEYGLLAAVIALAGILLFPTIASKMGTAYQNWGTARESAWQPDPPVGGP